MAAGLTALGLGGLLIAPAAGVVLAVVAKPPPRAEPMRPATAAGADAVVLPPRRRVAWSSDRRHQLEILAVDGWRTPDARGRLWLQQGPTLRLVWEQPLPQPYGPRRMLVLPGGRVLLLDEGQNVRSRHALVLLDPQGRVLVRYGFGQIQALAGVSASLMVQRALPGSWWLSAPPRLEAGGSRVQLVAGGRQLELDPVSGELRRWP